MPAELPPPPDAPLPEGFAVRIAPATVVRDGGATLLGGSPMRLLRLSARAQALLDGDRLVVRDGTTATLAGRLLDAGVVHPDLPRSLPGGVTVVIPVRDRPGPLARLLRALRADPVTAELPVLVVDDGSRDPAAARAAATAAGAEVIRSERSQGPAAARNRGLRAAGTPLVAFLDSDCVPAPGWLEALGPHLVDPRVAVVAPRIVALGEPAGRVAGYETAGSALDMGEVPAPVRPFSAVPYVPSAALLARREALAAGFDEALAVAEDVDLVWRLAAAGWRVRYEPAGTVAHEHRATAGGWLRRRAFYGTGAPLLAARHGPAVAPVVISPWSALVWALLVLPPGRFAWLSRAAAAGVLGLGAARLARKLGGRDELLLSVRLVAGGTALAGRTVARSAVRTHWPLTLLVALASRRARRWALAAAVSDAVLAWLPHRREVGLLPFAALRRLEDLGYGAGVWAGMARERSLRALLPGRPPGL